jgi:hypothetical protein
MSPKIFISYRRIDKADFTDRVYDKLCEAFDSDNVFLVVTNIPLGFDFREHLANMV